MEHLNFYNILENRMTRESIIQKLKDDKRPVIIYGTGTFGKFAGEYVLKNDIPIICFLDKEDYWKPGKTVIVRSKVFRCICSDELSEIAIPYNLLLGLIDYSLLEELRSVFPNCNYVEYLDAAPCRMMSKLFLIENQSLFNELYLDLCDNESKNVLEAYLYGRYTGDVSLLSSLKHDSEYMYDWELLSLSKDDIVVDGGAYIGDSILEMNSYVGGLPKKVFAFEPDEDNRSKLIANISKERLNNVVIVPAGLYSKEGSLQFSKTGTQRSVVSEAAESVVLVQALDDHEEYREVSVIKMDIEGSEIDALYGCRKLILTQKPRLAICIYHRNSDILYIYKFLKNFGYQFYLRQHFSALTETVLYAI